MAQINWRTVNVDLYDPESSYNFDIQTVIPGNVPAQSNAQEAAQIAQQVRQLLRAGDGVGALQSALETIPYAGDDQAKQVHLTTCLGRWSRLEFRIVLMEHRGIARYTASRSECDTTAIVTAAKWSAIG